MWERNANALLAIILAVVLGGALGIQFFKHETPCALCMLQRLGMLGVAAGALMNVKFGPRKIHYGLCLFAAIFGGFVALRQISLHVCPQFPTFGVPFWGLSLYTWSFIVYACSILYVGLLLMIFDRIELSAQHIIPNWWGQLAFALVFLVAVFNIFSAVWICKLGTC